MNHIHYSLGGSNQGLRLKLLDHHTKYTMPPKVTFRRMEADDCPQPRPMTPEDQAIIGPTLHIPQEHWHRIQRGVAVSMPDLPMCLHYVDWIDTISKQVISPFGFIIEPLNVWKTNYGEQALRDMIDSMISKGCPTHNWVFTYYLKPERK